MVSTALPTSTWAACPDEHITALTIDDLHRLWSRLHQGDGEPLPTQPALLAAWLLYHQGHFEAAANAGLILGPAGHILASKAACMHATYVEPHEGQRLARLQQTAERSRTLQIQVPTLANAWYWQGYALGRYSQGVSVARSLAMGLGARIKAVLERTLELAPEHVDAHLALATFHAEVIDKVGELIAGMTYGARKDTGLALYERALALRPESLIVLHEGAHGQVLLNGEAGLAKAQRLRERAAGLQPMDAMERLYLQSTRVDLLD